MSDDFFREVEEEVRRERLQKLWKDYGDYIAAGASLLILAAGGFQLWRVYEARQLARASNQYLAAMNLMQNGQSEAAARAFARLGKEAPRGYSHLSELQAADALLAAGNRTEAVALYRRIVANGDDMLSAVARIRAAWAIVDTAPRADVEALLAPLTASTSPWRPMAQEILAYADYRSGAIGKARVAFERLAKDPATSPGIKQRANAMATFIAAGGDSNVGVVPEPVMPKSGTVTGGNPSKARAEAAASRTPAATSNASANSQGRPQK